MILTVGREVGRLGGVECSVTFSSWTSSETGSEPLGSSLDLGDGGRSRPGEECVLRAGDDVEAAGTSAPSSPGLEGEGSK